MLGTDFAEMGPFVSVRLHGFDFHLSGTGAAHWIQQNTLFVADLHLGKDVLFRQSGTPFPEGSTQCTLRRLAREIREIQPERLVVLGDMFHARAALTNEIHGLMDHFTREYPNLPITLVPGNHDRGMEQCGDCWGIEITSRRWNFSGICCQHDPAQQVFLNCESPACDGLKLCGHIHPSVRTGLAGRKEKLSCFWYSRDCLILPAFGTLAGTHRIQPQSDDRLWCLAQDQIFELTKLARLGKPL